MPKPPRLFEDQINPPVRPPENPEADDPAPVLQGKATLDVDQAIMEIRRLAAKGNGTPGLINELLLELIDNHVLSREVRAAVRGSTR